MRRLFKPGDVVTWGRGKVAHRVIEVTSVGVVVDSTSSGFGNLRKSGQLTMLIEFAPGSRSYRSPGPPRLSGMAPDR